jgi:hypothetical protein
MNQTMRADRFHLIGETLAEIGALLDRSDGCADVRELRAELIKLERAIDRWRVVRPDAGQLSAMHERVVALHDRALQLAPAISGVMVSPQERETVRAIRVAARAG